MTFRKAYSIYWKANPWFQITVFFSLLFGGAIAWAGGPGVGVVWVIVGLVYTVLIGGSIVNVLALKKREEHREKISKDKS